MNNIKRARIAKGMQQKELAITIGVSQSAVTAWETGAKNPSMANIAKMAKALDVSVSYLLGEEQAKEKEQPERAALMSDALNRFSDLPQDVQILALAYADGLLAMRGRK